tara:strand:+ start:17202 stop:17708 length:507 start_codon:yes stop_codon:yes gene_type:complete
MSNNIKSYIKKITEELNDLEEMSATGNLDGGAGPPKTPYAFSGKTDKDDEKEESNAESSTGYKMVKKKPKKIFVGKMGESIYKKAMNELTYNDYKSDPSSTPKAKVNTAIKEINRKLFEIERIVKQNNKLKTEMGVSSDNYWKSSKTRIGKIGERILRIGRQLKELAG